MICPNIGKKTASVVVNYASSAKGAQECVGTIERVGGRAIAVRADLASVAEIKALFDQARQAFGRIDIVVAYAEIEIVGISALDFAEEQFDRAIAVNTKGAFFTLQQAGRTVEGAGVTDGIRN